MERQNKYRVIVSALAADNTHIPMGIPASVSYTHLTLPTKA